MTCLEEQESRLRTKANKRPHTENSEDVNKLIGKKIPNISIVVLENKKEQQHTGYSVGISKAICCMCLRICQVDCGAV